MQLHSIFTFVLIVLAPNGKQYQLLKACGGVSMDLLYHLRGYDKQKIVFLSKDGFL
jgi:hypothetical protein